MADWFLTIPVIILVIVLFALLLFCVIGYLNNLNDSEVNISDNDYRLTLIFNNGSFRILVDNETGVQYLSSENGVTVMLDEDGRPLIYREGE
jgi:hypothetical protein